MIRVLLCEPYLTGSHREWAEGYRAASGLEIDVLALPGRFWKWRMHGAAVTFARMLRESGRSPDVVLASDMLDLAAFAGLARDTIGGAPLVLFMHENQLAYPTADAEADWSPSRRRRAERRDAHYAFVNLTSALAADRVIWNSAHNRDTFLAALPSFLGAFPDARETTAIEAVRQRSVVLPVGIDLPALDAARPASRSPGPPRVLWNHRWEHDKDPGAFFAALDRLAARGLDFEVIVLGEAFVRTPPAFERARARLGARVRRFGHVADRAEYARWLWEADVVVSTARHEFFGVAVVEAMACGCWPVLPDRLAYPEIVPAPLHADVLYRDADDLAARLAAALTRPPGEERDELRRAAACFAWSTVAPRYDRLLETLARLPDARSRGAA